MKRGLARAAAGLLLAGSTATLVPACADNTLSLFVVQVQAESDDKCEVRNDPGEAFRSSGVLDLAINREYDAALLVGNQLVRRGDEKRLRDESSRIQLFSADVAVLDASGNVLQRDDGSTAEFATAMSGFVEVGTGTEPGFGLASALLIDSATSERLLGDLVNSQLTSEQVIARVIVRGRTLGGNEIESAEWDFPITVCLGCLRRAPSDADDLASAEFDCDQAGTKDILCPACRFGMDRLVDCCCLGPACCQDANKCAL